VAAGRSVAYVVLIVRAPSWFEGFYANVVADLVRAGLVVTVALALVHLWVRLAARPAGPTGPGVATDGPTAPAAVGGTP
jgi:hypothetical protein